MARCRGQSRIIGASASGQGAGGRHPQFLRHRAGQRQTAQQPRGQVGRYQRGEDFTEALATDLGLDVYKIDLALVVSKYIGETEKNLDRIFDEAQESDAILFFDEADALFGKRTRVRDAHDRFANIEIDYLLQRMERFPGVLILATDHHEALDDRFVRQLRFRVEFGPPAPPLPAVPSRGPP